MTKLHKTNFRKPCSSLLSSVLLALGLVLGACMMKGADSSYWTTFPRGYRDWRVICPIPGATSVYQDSMSAIEILGVSSDGKSVEPEMLSPATPPDTTSINADGRAMIYQFTLGFFECWVDPKADRKELVMRRFELSEKSHVIEIRYRARYPDGSKSDELKVSFVATDQPVNKMRVK